MIGAIIQARLTSTRLPRKHLLELNGKPLLEHLVERARACFLIDKVILSVPHSPECCLNEEIFIGNQHDVLDRYYQTAKKYSISTIVRLTGDCPLVPTYEITRVIRRFLQGGTDYVTNILDSRGRFGVPDGWDVECFSFKALEDANFNAKEQHCREHVTPYIKNNPLNNPVFLDPLKLSIDTIEDYKILKEFYTQEAIHYQLPITSYTEKA